jgi:hypothetical protein
MVNEILVRVSGENVLDTKVSGMTRQQVFESSFLSEE